MSEAANAAQLAKVMDAILAEFERQGIVDQVAELGLDLPKLAEAVIKAAEGHVIPFQKPR